MTLKNNLLLPVFLFISISFICMIGISTADTSGTETSDISKNTAQDSSSPDLFDRSGGYLHPFVSVTEYYTDNVWNTNKYKRSDWGTILSGGIILSVPRTANPPTISTNTTTPGGISSSSIGAGYPGRYHTYFSYNADYEYFARKSSSNTLSHNAVGSFQYKFRGGLSVEVFDQFLKSHETRGTGEFFGLDQYRSNLLNSSLSYEIGDRFLVRADYSNFIVRYSDSQNDFRDRADNAWSGYVFYKVTPKTSMFVQYQYIDISYRDSLNSSSEDSVYGGVIWKMSGKTDGMVKAGYGKKNFDRSSLHDTGNFIYEAQMNYNFTPKTMLSLIAARRTVESDIATTVSGLADSIKAEYRQRIMQKLTFSLGLSYSRQSYNGDLTISGETKRKIDDVYSGTLALRYQMRKGLNFETAYSCSKRESTFADYNYLNNTILFRIAASL